jgi:hypothetical protein
MPTFATSVPRTEPIAVPVTSAASTARYHGQPLSVSSTASTAAHTPDGVARGQVDLAQQQDEDQAHRDER